MPWSRHDLLFRRTALATIGLIPKSKWIGSGLIASVSITAASVCPAQTFTPIGPRYSGEVILSERIISPEPERLPAPKQQPKPTLSIAGKEPASLSDGGKQSELPLASQTPIFALGNDVWKRMLDLERENADLKAELEYERKLASYIERSEIQYLNQSDMLAQLQTKLEEMQRAGSEKNRQQQQAIAKIEMLTDRNQAFEKKIQQLELELQRAESSQIAQAPTKSQTKRPDARRQPPKSVEATKKSVEIKSAPQLPAPMEMPTPLPKKSGAEKIPAKRAKPSNQSSKADDVSKASLESVKESDEEPVGPVSLAVMPIGFEIPENVLKPEQGEAADAEEGLQGGPRGPLGRSTP